MLDCFCLCGSLLSRTGHAGLSLFILHISQVTLANMHTLTQRTTTLGVKQQCKQSCLIWMGNAYYFFSPRLLPLLSCSPSIIPPSLLLLQRRRECWIGGFLKNPASTFSLSKSLVWPSPPTSLFWRAPLLWLLCSRLHSIDPFQLFDLWRREEEERNGSRRERKAFCGLMRS